MWTSFPSVTKIGVEQGIGGAIELSFKPCMETDVPETVRGFLDSHGWRCVGHHPDTSEPLWYLEGGHGTEFGYFKWEQAVAYQMFLFMNIGPDPIRVP